MEADHVQAPPPAAGFPSILRVPAGMAGLRADAFLFHELPAVSRTRIRQKIQMGESLLNGHRFSTSTRLRAGDEVRVTWRGTPATSERPARVAVLYEDDGLLIVDKPAGVPTHPMGRHQADTVVQFARHRYEAEIRRRLEAGDRSYYPTVANRLDVLTSGVVILALRHDVHVAMQALVTRRLVSREYIALVEGCMEDDEGLIDLPIGPSMDSAVRLKMACRPDGRESRTRYEVIERLARHTLVRVFPLTGRQHQIRVHLAAIGHPVYGELLYTDESLFIAAQARQREGSGGPATPRHCLHAHRVTFVHPMTGARVEALAPIPADFERIVAEVRSADRGFSG